jgi:hypothetical protein
MRLRNTKFWPILFTLSALLAGAAYSQSSTVAPSPATTPTPMKCPFGGFASPRLFYPSPGATMVPTNLGEIIVAGIPQGAFALVAAKSSPLPIGPVEDVPSPTPTTLPASNPSSYYHAIPVPTLSPGITYSVVFTADNPGPCPPLQASGIIGSFGT